MYFEQTPISFRIINAQINNSSPFNRTTNNLSQFTIIASKIEAIEIINQLMILVFKLLALYLSLLTVQVFQLIHIRSQINQIFIRSE